MTPTRVLLLTLAGLLIWPTASRAQNTAASVTQLSGVTVVRAAKEPPKVVAAFPQAGVAVQPGALIVKVTFDQKMDPTGWDFGKGRDGYPNCLDRPRLLADEKTFVLLCTAGARGRFSIALNAGKAGGFANLAGQRAAPSEVDFSTDDGAALSTIEDAMKAAGLARDQGPVMQALPGQPLGAALPR